MKIHQVQKKLSRKHDSIPEEIYFIDNTFEFQVRIRFSGKPMTQCTCQSHANVNHVRT